MTTSAQVEIERVLDREGAISRVRHPDLRSAVDWLVDSGRLARVLPGIYVRSVDAENRTARIRALVQLEPNAVLTGQSAAAWSFWPGLRGTCVQAALQTKRVAPAGFSFARRRVPAELIRHVGGVYLTAPALTALDLVPELGGDAIDQVLRVGAATLDELKQALELSPRRRGNCARAAMLLDSRDNPWAASERLLHRLLRDAGLVGWETNVEVRLPGGRVFLDAAFEAARVALEVDGWEFHARHPTDFDATLRRHSNLEAAGWRVLHFTWSQLVDDPEWVLATILATLAQEKRPVDGWRGPRRR